MTAGQDTVIIEQSILPPDNTITINHPPKIPPKGFVLLPEGEKSPTISKIARGLLGGDFGTLTPFSINTRHFMARVEPHYHNPPPPNATPEEQAKYPKPWGWHKGVTIYKSINDIKNTFEQSSQSISPRMRLLQRIDEFYQQFGKI